MVTKQVQRRKGKGKKVEPTEPRGQTLYGSSVCTHRGVKEVAKYGTVTVSAGSFAAVQVRYTDFDLFVALNNRPSIPPIDSDQALLRVYPVLQSAVERKPHIKIEWTDFAPPPLPATFFHDLFQQFRTGPAKKIVVYCQGGHGRTGTFIALLYHAMGKKDVVNLARDVYCKKAVESDDQMDYLRGAGCDVGNATACMYGRHGSKAYHRTAADDAFNDAVWGQKTTKLGNEHIATSSELLETYVDVQDKDTPFACIKPWDCEFEAGDPRCIHCGLTKAEKARRADL